MGILLNGRVWLGRSGVGQELQFQQAGLLITLSAKDFYSSSMYASQLVLFFTLIKVTKTSGLRPMEPRDIKEVRELTNSYLKRFHLAPVMDEEEVAHWFLPQEHIIDTFVVEVKRS